MDSQDSVESVDIMQNLPTRPEMLPYPPTEANIPKLKEYLVNKFKPLVFNKTTPFKAMKYPTRSAIIKLTYL